MPERNKKNKSRKTGKIIDCLECDTQADCCKFGAWADLEEAKKIVTLGLKGEFFQLEKDDDFPSGYKIGTSYEDDPCSFLDSDGLCSIHKIGYHLKPSACRDFPYEDNKVSPFADVLCTLFKSRIKNKNKK
ncbi:YkgJ family cysteine cluster protein [bacterium]|nr:MAG: YkgJ family cysteine cluster protein [bacterium]